MSRAGYFITLGLEEHQTRNSKGSLRASTVERKQIAHGLLSNAIRDPKIRRATRGAHHRVRRRRSATSRGTCDDARQEHEAAALASQEGRFEALIEEAIVDAYGESEQRTGFYTMIEEHLRVPFEAGILGVAATVERIDMTDDEQIVAICRRGRSRQPIPILDLPLPAPLPAGAEWIEAYRHWAHAV